MYEVVIIQRRLTHYRVPLFELMKKIIQERGVRLRLIVGEGTLSEKKKHDSGEIPWAEKIPTKYFLGDRICWLPLSNLLENSDLVVVTQENKLIQNLPLLMLPRKFKLAFWGHGANLQSANPDGIKEKYKRWTTSKVDWWFAYTKMSAALVESTGFPLERVTVLNNAVDTSELQCIRKSITQHELKELRASLGFGDGPIGVFVGSLYADKRLDFLFESATAIKSRVPNFQLLIIGDGQLRNEVQTWCSTHSWARWVGAQFGREKVVHLAIAQIMLNPGLVGLGILDSFVCGVPMITTDCGLHSPEIVYLSNNINGLITENSIDAYVDGVCGLLLDENKLKKLADGCFSSASIYTIRNMARNFADGVERCLALPTAEITPRWKASSPNRK